MNPSDTSGDASIPGDELIIRVAARGDGVTASGRHVADAAPGDMVRIDGTVVPGPNHVAALCRHFPLCGGCQLQHVSDASLADFVRDRVVFAAKGQNLDATVVASPHLSPMGARRRASLHAGRANGRVVVGFKEEGAHGIVDLRECPVMLPALAALVAPLRQMLVRHLEPAKTAGKGGKAGKGAKAAARIAGKAITPARLAVDIALTMADQGPDMALTGLAVEGLAANEAWLAFAQAHGLARLTLDQGYGPEALWEPEPVTVTLGMRPDTRAAVLGGIAVALPPGGFLQATADGEAALVGAVVEWLDGVEIVADLFSGLGTFSFALARAASAGDAGVKVYAAEAERAAHLACKAAADKHRLPVHCAHRDLFRNPLLVEELNRFGAVLLDPPRAGARDQVARLAASSVPRVAYVSCNPASWARDAAMLAAGGYRLAELRPVGQFRWSSHVELASLFVK